VALFVIGCGPKEEPAPATDAGVSASSPPEAAPPVASTEAPDESGWTTSLDEGLAQAKKEGKMVLVDFSAEW
jgi:thiol:disulfide interchange protein